MLDTTPLLLSVITVSRVLGIASLKPLSLKCWMKAGASDSQISRAFLRNNAAESPMPRK